MNPEMLLAFSGEKILACTASHNINPIYSTECYLSGTNLDYQFTY